MDALNLSPEELKGLKDDLLGFVHMVANGKADSSSEINTMPFIAKLLIENTGVIRLQKEQLKTVQTALLMSSHDFSSLSGLVAYDGVAPSETFEIDNSTVSKAIDEAISVLAAASCTCTYDCREYAC